MQAEVGFQAAEKALDAGDLEAAKAMLIKATDSDNTLPQARDGAVTEIALLQGLSADIAAAFALAASAQSQSARLEAFAHAARGAWFRDAAGAEAANHRQN